MSKDAKIGIVVVLVIVAILGVLMFRNRGEDQVADIPEAPPIIPPPVVETADNIVTPPAEPTQPVSEPVTPPVPPAGGTTEVVVDPTAPVVEQGAAAGTQPVTVPATTPAPETTWEYTVKAGDMLETIAREQLGSPRRSTEIAKLNNITNPKSLQIGQKLKMPAKDSAPVAGDETTPVAGNPPAEAVRTVERTAPVRRVEQPAVIERRGGPSAPIPGTEAAAPAPIRAQAGDKYTVKAGDTLRKIAREQLGDEAQWSKIADVNGIVEPYRLNAGQEISLP